MGDKIDALGASVSAVAKSVDELGARLDERLAEAQKRRDDGLARIERLLEALQAQQKQETVEHHDEMKRALAAVHPVGKGAWEGVAELPPAAGEQPQGAMGAVGEQREKPPEIGADTAPLLVGSSAHAEEAEGGRASNDTAPTSSALHVSTVESMGGQS